MLPGGEALLRALLGPRPESLPRSGAVTGPQPAAPVTPVANHPRLPTRAASGRQAQAAGGVARAPAPLEQQDAAAADGATPFREGAFANAGATTASSGTAPAQLSTAARAIGALLDAQGSEAPAPLHGAAPLWSSPAPPPAPALARALAHAVDGSGLFYEAHLRQLAEGTRTPAQLREEPQGRLAGGVASDPAAAADALDAPSAGPAPASPSTPAAAPDPMHATVLHPGTAEIVQQQLQLLASGVFRWSGEPWPGARMDWQIDQDVPEAAAEGTGRAWRTRLQVVLPSLGEIDATLRIGGDGALQVRVSAADARAAGELMAARAALMQRLGGTGLSVQACVVVTG